MRKVLAAVTLLALGASAAWAADPPPDFAKQGRPFLQKHCIDCHSGKEPEAGLRLDAFRDYDSLVRGRKAWDKVLRMVRSGKMPPKDEPQPTADEVAGFTGLVDRVFQHAVRNAKPDPGRVTMRRLNRTEYRNTIRDLVGVDFDPTEDFPSDDIGHGFDNIGDVLTLPPVLMERYLAAAESIMQRAIVPNPPKPTRRHLGGQYTEPAGNDVPKEGNYRVMSTGDGSPQQTGPIHTPYKWDDEGEYIYRTRVHVKTDGDQPVRVALLVTGKGLSNPTPEADLPGISGAAFKSLQPCRVLKVFELKPPEKNNRDESLEVNVPPMSGRERMAVALVKPTEGQPQAKLYLQWVQLEGPLDMRPASHRRLLACSPDKSQAEQTREVLRRFATRAYRRAVDDAELQRLASLVDAQVAAGDKWDAAMQLAFQAVLCSPKFLFRVELDQQPKSPQVRPLDEYQLASRLSYFLWSTMPDDELLTLAGKKQLTANLDAQVKRMLADPRSSALVENFALQWLQLKRLEMLAPDPKLFPQFNEPLRRAMLQETSLFFASVMREDRSILDLLDANYTYVNDTLARHYGLQASNRGRGRRRQGSQDEPFRRVELPADSLRGGLLTQASVLTVTSNPTRTSPVKRGRWVLEQLLGAPPPPPPPNVPELAEDKQAVESASLRERLRIHRENPSCANCHAKMDPLGFALENFDAVGAFRTKDGAFEIDPSGELPDGQKFAGPAELKQILIEKKELFARCLAEKMLIYALGRGLEYYDQPTIDRIYAALEKNDYRFSTLVTEIARSDPFRMRRGG